MPDTPKHRKVDYTDDGTISAIRTEEGRQSYREALRINKDYFDEVLRVAQLLGEQSKQGLQDGMASRGADDKAATEKTT